VFEGLNKHTGELMAVKALQLLGRPDSEAVQTQLQELTQVRCCWPRDAAGLWLPAVCVAAACGGRDGLLCVSSNWVPQAIPDASLLHVFAHVLL
jgi:hypothetical protein